MPREATASGFDPERLRDARVQAGLTQAELAEQAGTDPTTIAKYETGARTPYVERLAALAAALGVTPSRLSHPPRGTVADLRAAAGLSQHAAAARAAMVRTTYAAIERGEVAVLERDAADRLAAAFDVPVEVLTAAHAQARATYLRRDK